MRIGHLWFKYLYMIQREIILWHNLCVILSDECNLEPDALSPGLVTCIIRNCNFFVSVPVRTLAQQLWLAKGVLGECQRCQFCSCSVFECEQTLGILMLQIEFWQVTDELLGKIASRSQNITEINISDCRNVSDTGVCVLASKCPGLLRYTAYRCKQLSDTSIIAVASQCPQLQKVHVGNQDRLTDEGLKQVSIKYPC